MDGHYTTLGWVSRSDRTQDGPNAGRQARLAAGAKHERTLAAVACTPMLGKVSPLCSPAVLLFYPVLAFPLPLNHACCGIKDDRRSQRAQNPAEFPRPSGQGYHPGKRVFL